MLASLLSADNVTRKAAEEEFDRLQQTEPAELAAALMSALVSPTAEEAEQQIAAVLLRRVAPKLLPRLPVEAITAVKMGLLHALHTARSPVMQLSLIHI